MKSKINSILQEIDKKRLELKGEYIKLMEKYDFSLIKGKIIFSKEAKQKYKKYKKPIFETIFTAQIREIVSIPFIYAMYFPVLLLDIMLFIYQQTAFRLYKIPIVKRSDYVVYDRAKLGYLNIIQKINCVYCSYFNGIVQYAVEIGGRTEKYWCPIKHVKKELGGHNWEKCFADYGDVEGFKEVFGSIKEFENKSE